MASSRLRDSGGGSLGDAYQVLTLRDGRIVDIQGCRSRREAMRFARSH